MVTISYSLLVIIINTLYLNSSFPLLRPKLFTKASEFYLCCIIWGNCHSMISQATRTATGVT